MRGHRCKTPFPEDWTLATIIPIPKPGKDPAEPNKYRPIALTSCLCKTLERMINKRLTWFLESNNHISRFQSGFRSDRSTTDNFPGESLPPCRGLWGTLHTGDDIDCNTCLLWEC